MVISGLLAHPRGRDHRGGDGWGGAFSISEKVELKSLTSCLHYASFTPNNFKINLLPTVRSDWLQTGKVQLGYIGIAWFCSHQF